MQSRFPARRATQSRRRTAPVQSAGSALEPLESRTLLAAAGSEEFQVNTHTRDHQRFPAVAADADGDFVVTWESYQQEDSDWNIYAQRFAADGTPRGGEFRVNQDTGIYNTHSSVGMDDAGNFVVSWTQGPYGHVHARQFLEDGSPLGDEFIVDWRAGAGTSSVAVDPDGDFVVAWDVAVEGGDRRDVFAQSYNARGGRWGIIQVNTNPTGSAWKADVAADADGQFAVAFEVGEDAAFGGTYVRKFNALSVPLLPEARVSSGPVTSAAPAVAMADDGSYVVAWGGAEGVKARRFHSFGVADGGDLLVSGAAAPQALDVAAGPDGNFVVAWSATAADGFSDVYGRGYTPAGAAMGNAFRLNVTTISQQMHPAAAGVDATGRFVATWDSWGQDGDLAGVFGRRFADASGPHATVVGRRVFYNNSAFDGASPLAGLADDGAVPSQKVALRAGGTASFLNVTSYTRGINGVMVDVADLPEGVAPRVDDFSFRSRADAGGAWAAGPTPWRVTTRRLASGRHRVTMLWRDYNPHDGVAHPDEAVANGWLEVTMKANERTRLAAPDVFSFGNLIGKTGNGGPAGTLAVTAADVERVRAAQGTSASINNVFDFNRDGRVNVLDLGVVRSRAGTALPLPTVQRLGVATAPTAAQALTPAARSSYVAQVLS